ncbi:MAG: hypothetical protein CMI36_14020 [Owenweeksia sp.]|nr:hypothetical protein [Owenweeksia sp.]MBG00108.1 hypothetical protein [Owenweeksia sp.]HBF19933.1 hypothetical protein [Cryomorphaceae bacterium]
MAKQQKDQEGGKLKSRKFQRIFTGVYLLTLIFLFFNLYPKVFDEKIALGGDNAGYYLLGQSLASGNGYKDTGSIENKPHTHFPPGYPALIAASSKLGLDDIISVKRVSGFFFLTSILLLFLLVKRMTESPHIAFIAGLFTLYNFHMLSYSVIIMSEMAFTVFSLLCIWLITQVKFEDPLARNWRFFLLIVLLAGTYYIRSTGIALVVTVIALLVMRKQWNYLLTFIVGWVALIIPWYFRSKALGGSSYVDQLMMKNPYNPQEGTIEFTDIFVRIWDNIVRYTGREIPYGLLNFVEKVNYQEAIPTRDFVIGAIAVALIIFGAFRIKKYRILICLYVLFTLGILMLWPKVWFGVRFIIPLIPILTFMLLYGMVEVLQLAARYLLNYKEGHIINIGAAVLSILIIGSYSSGAISRLEATAKANYPAIYHDYFELAKWANANVPDTSVIACRKLALFHIFSHRYVCHYKNTEDPDEQLEFLKSQSVDYVLFDRLGYTSTQKYLYPAIKRYAGKFPVVAKMGQPETVLLKFEPDMGYSGDFKGEEKWGQGTYRWNNGAYFVGEWKNNVRNGEGILYTEDGRSLKGVWTNDSLNGEVQRFDAQGNFIDKVWFKGNVEVSDRPQGS